MSDYIIAIQKIGLTSGHASCGYCNLAHDFDFLNKKESTLTNEQYHYRLEFLCPISNKVILGADV